MYHYWDLLGHTVALATKLTDSHVLVGSLCLLVKSQVWVSQNPTISLVQTTMSKFVLPSLPYVPPAMIVDQRSLSLYSRPHDIP